MLFFVLAVDGWGMIPGGGRGANDMIRSSGSLQLPFHYIVGMRKESRRKEGDLILQDLFPHPRS